MYDVLMPIFQKKRFSKFWKVFLNRIENDSDIDAKIFVGDEISKTYYVFKRNSPLVRKMRADFVCGFPQMLKLHKAGVKSLSVGREFF